MTSAGQDARVISLFPEGVVTPPPSKSISHRAMICASLAEWQDGRHRSPADPRRGILMAAQKRIRNLGASDDIAATRDGLAQILAGDASVPVDCAESGSTLRFLIPLAAALSDAAWLFTGRGRLPQRPQAIYAETLPLHGVSFSQSAEGIRVRGQLQPGIFSLRGDVSSQFVSGLLLALPLLEGDSEIRLTTPLESADYVRMTVDVMRSFGIDLEEVCQEDSLTDEGQRIVGWKVPGAQRFLRAKFRVEADWSQAAFFLCSAALGRRVAVDGLGIGSMQGDRRILHVLSRMGAEPSGEVRAFPHTDTCTVRIQVPEQGLMAADIDVSDIPDLVPPIAALACYCKGRTRLYNAARLRIKESDRLRALATELGRLGADIEEEADGLVIRGRESLRGG
ncbi:MAG: 3-phosphoshikimate 1-carboxyvinyltransferase, partial [Clostridiales Family XIII bacterium]|nr:3-phosphoshikimate 1-carboxyvinyltransferase [Clostridiales Family XIII bacterium]